MKIFIKASIATTDIKSIQRNLFLYYGVLKNEVNSFFNDYEKVLDREDEIDNTDIVSRGKLYIKYHPLAEKCQEIIDTFSTESAGRMSDYILVEEMLKDATDVIDNFPYEWEDCQDYVRMAS